MKMKEKTALKKINPCGETSSGSKSRGIGSAAKPTEAQGPRKGLRRGAKREAASEWGEC